MVVGDTHVFPGFLTPVLTQLFFPKSLITFLTCFCRGESENTPERKFTSTRDRTQKPPDHESDMLTTEPPGQAKLV